MEMLPFEIAETAHSLRKAFDRMAVGLGVTRAQWKVLFKLTRIPGLRQVELADMLELEPITLCRIVDRLEEAGLVDERAIPRIAVPGAFMSPRRRSRWSRSCRRSVPRWSTRRLLELTPTDIETTRKVLAQARENACRCGIMNRASN